ncbi:MAG: hypothetical protein NT051_04875 [Candidatus Micrarchaeota archaeon]|nr:hypothetical protein [Candidatus Micrarchaeota archaeon]
MHKCVRCGRAAASLEEIDSGCPCGSKAFVFGRYEPDLAGGNGKAEGSPQQYNAHISFASEDVENIKVLSEGVFVLNVKGLSRDPMVLKDEDGIYYVKIPFEQRMDGNKPEGNGKMKGEGAKKKE